MRVMRKETDARQESKSARAFSGSPLVTKSNASVVYFPDLCCSILSSWA